MVLCGTGAHGAYHAGVLRALQEAGVKIDLVAGQGAGAGAAALAALDGGSRLWDVNGPWRSPTVASLYSWKPPLRAAAWLAALVLAILCVPLALLALGLVVLPAGFLLEMLGADAGTTLVGAYTGWLQSAFQGQNLPTWVPRAAVIALALLVVVLAGATALGVRRARVRRRSEGAWWWRLAGAPLEAESMRQLFTGALWELIRGAAPTPQPDQLTLGRRYAEVLQENLGQPGFAELVLVATDLDARRDVVAALLREPFRADFLAPRPERDRRSEVVDLSGVGRDLAMDVVSAALTPPIACDPHLVTFAPDSFWRGETHRFCDRPGCANRLLEEVAAAGATQVVVVSAVALSASPHRLRTPRLDLRSRLGDFLSAAEAAALRDALEMARLRFDSVYLVSPAHNPVGPFDLKGAYDSGSDRRQELGELMEHGYEDAYHQFIEPVVGASGEQLARLAPHAASVVEPSLHGDRVFDDMR